MYPGTFAARFADKPAVIIAETGERLTYRELEDNSLRLARYLYDAGFRRGDHLALLADNTPQAYEVYWAAVRSGFYITAVNWHLAVPEISYIVNDCGARVLIASAALRDVAATVVRDTPAVDLRLMFGAQAQPRGSLPGGFGSYEAALAGASPEPLPAQPRGADMLYSSGTTGRPKGIKKPLPERQVDEPGDLYTELLPRMYGFDADTVYLSPAPVYHAAPLRYSTVIHAVGGTVVLMRGFDAQAALAAIERHRVTHSQWVPTMFVRMLKLPAGVREQYDLSSHRVAVHAAAPCPVTVKQAMIDWWGPILHEYYAATEAIGTTLASSEEWLHRPGTVGKATLGILHICADDGTPLPPGETGTVYFERHDPLFEYHNDPEKTAQARHPDHPTWNTTGDIGYLDADGYLYLTDRKVFLIISGGVNIYPQEIEDSLVLHPKVFDVAVVGMPDEEMGESVRAVVQPAGGVAPGPDLAAELTEFLRGRIASYKIPRRFDFVTELPRTPTGKMAKKALRG
ncbi:acyl-CoA synthetase [Parafrankia sp. EUN1f]|uniref:acyl-CoA synthetase n=1 Tax=Parafrankia sp. EUN1f TaxID=102897 RepID=UPI0001C45DF1|nr:acyl-CoA synthetase [Parafrankia sp. EUN1f]EFC84296.1 AMP-dependent synthetase and ligase [Parafrankia sp. EUN1f]